MLQNFDIPAWGGFYSWSGGVTCPWRPSVEVGAMGHGGKSASSSGNPDYISSECSVEGDIQQVPVPDSLHGETTPHARATSFLGEFYATRFAVGVSGSAKYSCSPGKLSGWMGHRSLLGTVEGYNYLPISFSLTSFWLNELFSFYVSGEDYKELGSPGYQYKTGDANNFVSQSDYNLHYLRTQNYFALPRMWTEDLFSSWGLRNQVVTGNLCAFLAKTFEQLQAVLAILSGGTYANFGISDTSSRVISALETAAIATEEGDTLSVSDRLARVESSLAQLIALTTYTYYVSGASLGGGTSSDSSAAEGVLEYLKSFLGSGGLESQNVTE